MNIEIRAASFKLAAMRVLHVTSGELTGGVRVEIRRSGSNTSEVLAAVEYTWTELTDRLGEKTLPGCGESFRAECARKWAVESLGIKEVWPATRYSRAGYDRESK